MANITQQYLVKMSISVIYSSVTLNPCIISTRNRIQTCTISVRYCLDEIFGDWEIQNGRQIQDGRHYFIKNCILKTYLGHNYEYLYGIIKKSHTGVQSVNTMFPTPKFSLFQISKWPPNTRWPPLFHQKLQFEDLFRP